MENVTIYKVLKNQEIVFISLDEKEARSEMAGEILFDEDIDSEYSFIQMEYDVETASGSLTNEGCIDDSYYKVSWECPKCGN